MNDTTRRMFGLIGVLAVVWIVTYWLYDPPASEPAITFGAAPGPLAEITPSPPTPHSPAPSPPASPPAGLPGPVRQLAATAEASALPPAADDLVRITRVEPPRLRRYTVRAGDTSFEHIAARQLGDRARAADIAQANPFVDPTRLVPGRTVLNLPQDGNVQGRLVTELVPASEAEPPPKHQTYTIASGDTLSGISAKVYGDSSRWRDLFEANRDVLADPDRLTAGVTIRIPVAGKDRP
ncbi:MAG TPA: LysM peptidoglycan-binding domain-containing protein [Phycisphaerales bacterium]|nr:LysM peptidoglycan-binding domain-containing protein [Phycisphaerales bacterium]